MSIHACLIRSFILKLMEFAHCCCNYTTHEKNTSEPNLCRYDSQSSNYVFLFYCSNFDVRQRASLSANTQNNCKVATGLDKAKSQVCCLGWLPWSPAWRETNVLKYILNTNTPILIKLSWAFQKWTKVQNLGKLFNLMRVWYDKCSKLKNICIMKIPFRIMTFLIWNVNVIRVCLLRRLATRQYVRPHGRSYVLGWAGTTNHCRQKVQRGW